MDLLDQIKSNINPSRYNLPEIVWNSLILNSRIRFHSFFKYIGQDEKKSLNEYAPKISNSKAYVIKIVEYIFIAIKFRRKKSQLLKRLNTKKITLHKTFCYESSIQNSEFKDPFFGRFTQTLMQSDDYLIIVDPIMKNSGTMKLLELNHINLIPWQSFLSFSDYLKVFLIQLKYYLQITPVTNAWDKEYKQELMHPATFHFMLFYFAFKKIAKKFNISRFILTFENNSWEKVAIQAFRKQSPQTKIIGYQHSVVPESTLGMRFLPWEIETNNLPDIIYTTGIATQYILQSFNPAITIPIQALCALRYEYLFSMTPKRGSLKKKILVALEAIKEAAELINIILEIKDYFEINDFKLIFRFHPAMDYHAFKPMINATKLESFAQVSTRPLNEDIDENDYVIYWGSTVALESAFAGNVLINFQDDFPLSHDPLFQCHHLKYVIHNSEELKKTFEDLSTLNLDFINKERIAAKNYLETYFHKPTDEDINVLLGKSI